MSKKSLTNLILRSDLIKSQMPPIYHRLLHLINDDTLTMFIICTTSWISFSYIYWSYWIAPWPGTLILLSLSIYSLYTVYGNINTYIAKLLRTMTGILIILFICAIFNIYFYPHRWEAKKRRYLEYRGMIVAIISLITVYKVRKIFLNRITLGCLIIAGILDSALIIYLVTRPNLGPLGPGLGRESAT